MRIDVAETGAKTTEQERCLMVRQWLMNLVAISMITLSGVNLAVAQIVRDHRGEATTVVPPRRASGLENVPGGVRVSPSRPAPIVRDHRGAGTTVIPPRAAPDASNRPGGVSVSPSSQAPIVRDHRVGGTTVTPWKADQRPQVVNPRTFERSSPFVYGMRNDITDKRGQGPNLDRPISLTSIASSQSVDLEPNDVLNIFESVYPDKNPNSGVWYFAPSRYGLDWDANQGYGMRMMYNATTTEGQIGEVLMAARLTAGVDSAEIQLAQALLVAAGHTVSTLRALPLARPPEVSLSGGLKTLFNIPPDKISSNPTSEVLGEIDIAWVTDTVTKENIELALTEEVGINGKLLLTPVGSAAASLEIPIKINIADSDTFGRFRWVRSQNWRNPTPYPLRLKYLHALMLKDNKPIIYSWGLGNVEIIPMAQVQWDARHIPSWIEKEAKRVWIDYAVKPGCDACDKQVMATITSGVSNITASQIIFETITPLADAGAYKLLVAVRSSYLNPRSHKLQVLPELPLSKDEQEYRSGVLYLGERSANAADPIFEYQLSVVMRDGVLHPGTQWMPSQNLRVLLGSAQIKSSLGFLPGKEPPKP